MYPAELIPVRMFNKLTYSLSFPKTSETFPHERLAVDLSAIFSIKISDVKKMITFGPETRFYRG